MGLEREWGRNVGKVVELEGPVRERVWEEEMF